MVKPNVNRVTLEPHQTDALKKMHNGCVLWGGVGTGKTITAMAYAVLSEPGKKINVITTAKVRDSGSWDKWAQRMDVPFDDFTVESWNKLPSFEDREGEFFIFDEQRLVGGGVWVRTFYKIAKKNNWILLSATPGDTWSDYGPMFVANGYYKNITEFRSEHAVYSRYTKYPKIEKWVGVNKLKRYRDELLVHMPMERHTTRHLEYVACDFDKEKLNHVRKTRWNIFKDEPITNAAGLFTVLRRVVSTDPSRQETLRQLMTKHDRLIVFYNFNYELEILEKMMREETTRSQKNFIERLLLPGGKSIKNDFSHSKTSSGSLRRELTGDYATQPMGGSQDLWEKLQTRLSSGATTGTSTKKSLSDKWLRSSSEKTSLTSALPSNSTLRAGKADNFTGSSQDYLFGIPGLGMRGPSTTILTLDTLPESIGECKLWESEESKTSANNQTPASAPVNSSTLKTLRGTSTELLPSTETVQELSSKPEKSFGWSQWNGHKHEPIPDTDRWVYLVQYESGSEGWNCTTTDAMVLWSLTYSYKKFEQVQGRIDRMNTPFTDLFYYVFYTKSFAERPVLSALRMKKNFQPK